MSDLRLSKTAPAHKVTMVFIWIKQDFMLYGAFRKSRERMGMRLKPWDKCIWCKTPFDDGDMMALAAVEKSGNRALCQTCAAKAECE
jgi:hypothetical protein